MDFNRLTTRVKAILLAPRAEWPVIAAEPATPGDLYKNYVAILALIPVVCGFLKGTFIGYGTAVFGTYRVGLVSGLGSMVVGYVMSLVVIYLMALIIDGLAPSFGAQRDRMQALKSAGYAFTASWIAGFGYLLPGISWLVLMAGAVYSIYLLYLGLPSTMKVSRERAARYTAVIVVVAILISWAFALLTGGIVAATMHFSHTGPFSSAPAAASGASSSGHFDEDSPMGRIEAATKQMEAADKSGNPSAQAAAAGAVLAAALGSGKESVPIDVLKPFVPETLAGMPRTAISTERNAALGIKVTEAHATYADGNGKQFRLEITDTAGVGNLVSIAAWAGVENESESNGRHEVTRKQGDRIIHEEWDNSNKHGEYSEVIGNRFVVEVSGDATDVAELRTAVESLNLAGLEALKN